MNEIRNEIDNMSLQTEKIKDLAVLLTDYYRLERDNLFKFDVV